MKNDVKEHLWAAFVLVVVLSSCLGIATWVVKHPMFSEEPGPSDAEIHAIGDRLATGVKAWQLENGRYPKDLEEAGLASPTAYRGGFIYESHRTGVHLRLGVADGINQRHSYTNCGIEGCRPGWSCAD